MHRMNPAISLFCVVLLLTPIMTAADAPLPGSQSQVPTVTRAEGHFAPITRTYRPSEVSPVNLSNSNRLDSLLRAGNLYLSLQDAIALALENNLDIELQRFSLVIADANILRAKSGGALRGTTPSVSAGQNSAPAGQGASGQNQTGVQSNAATQASTASSTGVLIQQTGSAIPNLDPSIQGLYRWGHTTTPQTNVIVTGTTAFVQSQDVGSATYNQGFLTGTSYSFGYADVRRSTNSFSDIFNPSRTGSLTLNINQHLLQGFGIAVNNRNIRQARNNREATDLQFKQQVIATVTNVMNLYWDLVSFNDDVKAKQQALAYNQKLYEDNKKQVEIGTLAPIEIVRAEAAVASSQQDLVLSETRVLQQETIIKNVLSKTGASSPALSEARIVPTDRIRIPDEEPIEPLQDMVANAGRARPEMSQRRINLENSKINLAGSKSQLLPTVDGFVNLGNNGLIGTPNTLPVPAGFTTNGRSAPNSFFLGGYGNLFSQLFGRNFPDYTAGFQVNIPIRNRAAQADYILDQVTVRQQEIAVQQLENQIRQEVQNAVIGLKQARAVYQSAVKARILQEQTLDAENKKLALGASTIFNVILVQRDLANALSAEVAAVSSYSKARVELERATGQTLETHNISIDEAVRGQVARAPSALPAVQP